MKNHVLHQLKFEVNAPSEMDGKQLQQDISKLIKERFIHKLESIFDKIGGEKNIRIPKLELEINDINSDNWEHDLIKKLTQQLSIQIKKWESDHSKNSTNDSKPILKKEDTVIYFLKYGTLPWWDNPLNINDLKTIFQSKIQSKSFQKELIQLLQLNPNARNRMVFQFENNELYSIIKLISKDSKFLISFIEKLQKVFLKWWSPHEVRHKIWNLVFKNILNKKLEIKKVKQNILQDSFLFFSKKKKTKSTKSVSENILLEELKSVFKNSNFHTNQSYQKPNNDKKEPSKNNLNTEGFYIDNAGLVILHPFFQYLFEDVGFTKDYNFENKHLQFQAALALQYLVTGKEISFEPDLIFNKILCNIPIDEPIENQLLISKKLHLECENLLKATIQHWSVLKSTTIDGLRNTFLQRAGKISQKENGDWLLQVQSSGVDVLLSKLPWGIGIVKLPWMEGTLFVEWQ